MGTASYIPASCKYHIGVSTTIQDAPNGHHLVIRKVINAIVAHIHHTDTFRCQRFTWVGTISIGQFTKRGYFRKNTLNNISCIVRRLQLKCNIGIDISQILICGIRNLDIPTHSENSRAKSDFTCSRERFRPEAISSNPLATSASNCSSDIIATFRSECNGNCTGKGNPLCITICR